MIGFATTMALLRGIHLAAMLSLLGTVGFVAWTLPAASVLPDPLTRQLRLLAWTSGVIALLVGTAWFALQAATIAGAENPSDVLDALPVVVAHTHYGTILMVRFGLLVVATGLVFEGRCFPGAVRSPAWFGLSGSPIRADAGSGSADTPVHDEAAAMGSRPDISAGAAADRARATGLRGTGRFTLHLTLALCLIALGLQGLIGHAGATAGAIGDRLLLSEALHLAAAGIWLGALLPLWLSLCALAPGQAASVCERFSPIGLACVLVLAGTGFAQALELVGSLPGLFGTRYGHVALLKILLFLIALGLAACNRLWLTDHLAAETADARRHLLVSVCCETCVGVAIVTAAAFMASSPPAAHTTPVWPFSWQLSLVTVNEDPELRREVVISLVGIGAAVALVVASLLLRRLRLAALAILALAVVLRGPSLAMLTVEAYPTSFQTSPTGFSAASIAAGQTLFASNCVACHGREGEGNGPEAAGLRIKPADLTMPHIWEHSDGEMFWWLTHGIDDPAGGLAMPGFGSSLSADERWALIDYVRAHNAGFAMRRDPASDVPVRAPVLPVSCAGVGASTTADLRGHVVNIVADDAVELEVPPQSGVSTINLALLDGVRPTPGACVAAAAAAWTAYAVLADLPPDNLAGAEFLVDPDGWLRVVHRPGEPGGWLTTDDLIAAVRDMCANPIQQPSGNQHEHHH
jgi:putative copper export protein/mono/diheme cytochrome c family protein